MVIELSSRSLDPTHKPVPFISNKSIWKWSFIWHIRSVVVQMSFWTPNDRNCYIRVLTFILAELFINFRSPSLMQSLKGSYKFLAQPVGVFGIFCQEITDGISSDLLSTWLVSVAALLRRYWPSLTFLLRLISHVSALTLHNQLYLLCKSCQLYITFFSDQTAMLTRQSSL